MEQFRPAMESDVGVIIEMMRCYNAEDGYPFVEAEARQATLDLIRITHLGDLLLVHEESRVVGYLAVILGFSLEYRGRDAFIDEVFITDSVAARVWGAKHLR